MNLYRGVALGLLLAASGCASFSSTLLHRSEDNSGWEKKHLLRGVPVTLKVPTHVRIDVTEKHFLVLDSTLTPDGMRIASVHRISARFPIREVTYSMIETEKIFLVDLKRPGAGTINAKLTFDADEQYFTEVKTKVVDETIARVGNLIAQIAPSGLIGAPTAEEAKPARFRGRVKEVRNVVASQVFEIDAPDYEEQVRMFLDRHLNCCHDCGVLPIDTRPAVELPARDLYPMMERPSLAPPVPEEDLPPVGQVFNGTPTLAAPIFPQLDHP